VAFGDDALEELGVLRLAQKIAGEKERRFDLVLGQRVQDVAGAFTEVAAGEDEGELLLRGVAARDAALVDGPRLFREIGKSSARWMALPFLGAAAMSSAMSAVTRISFATDGAPIGADEIKFEF